MSPLAGFLVLSSVLVSADAVPYQTALREAEAKNQPLMVLVGADWCPGCRTMKQAVLPSLFRRGALRQVSVATVDYDREPQLASQLMRGGSIPQLIVFSRDGAGKWHRQQVTGATSEAQVQSLVSQAVASTQAAAANTGANETGGGQ